MQRPVHETTLTVRQMRFPDSEADEIERARRSPSSDCFYPSSTWYHSKNQIKRVQGIIIRSPARSKFHAAHNGRRTWHHQVAIDYRADILFYRRRSIAIERVYLLSGEQRWTRCTSPVQVHHGTRWCSNTTFECHRSGIRG